MVLDAIHVSGDLLDQFHASPDDVLADHLVDLVQLKHFARDVERAKTLALEFFAKYL